PRSVERLDAACGIASVDRSFIEDARTTRGCHRRVSPSRQHTPRLWRCLLEPRQPQNLPVRSRGAGTHARRRGGTIDPDGRSISPVLCFGQGTRGSAGLFAILRVLPARQRAEACRGPLQTEVCTAALFERHRGSGASAADPIFIVGLPRSGSTLIEQILASHSTVEGTQE